MDFKIGDVVRLKSGGAYMVVGRVDDERVLCLWQDKTENGYEQKQNVFQHPDVLMLVDDKSLKTVQTKLP